MTEPNLCYVSTSTHFKRSFNWMSLLAKVERNPFQVKYSLQTFFQRIHSVIGDLRPIKPMSKENVLLDRRTEKVSEITVLTRFVSEDRLLNSSVQYQWWEKQIYWIDHWNTLIEFIYCVNIIEKFCNEVNLCRLCFKWLIAISERRVSCQALFG